ncbi:MAG TPA: J domain-containing protein, partial [Spirochaetia bacterium]
VAACAESFRTRGGLPDVAAITAERYLRRLFARHVLSRQGLLALLEHRLRLTAAERGFTDPEERVRARRTAGPARTAPSRRAWALGVMELEEEMLEADALRERYRQMMMRHHPDVDPAGLERCKDVNVAYSFLIAELVSGK